MPQKKSKYVKIVIYVPVTHAEKIRTALAHAGAGCRGRYDDCSFSTKGIGRFRPLKGARPFMGKVDKIETVKEERIETVCSGKIYKKVIKAVRAAHPYEEPAIDVLPLL